MPLLSAKPVFDGAARYTLRALIAAAMLPSINAWPATLAGQCNPVRVMTCTLPFPSDLFTEEDSASATGRRVVIPDESFALFANETETTPVALDRDVRPEALFQGASGFSTAAPVLFELDDEVDATGLASDGGKTLFVFEIGGDGTPVPIKAGVMKPAMTKGVARKDTVIEAFPRSRWKFGARYVAVLTRTLKSADGEEFSRSLGIQSIFDNPDSALGRAHAEALATAIPALATQGMGADDILALTFFTVRDEVQVITPLANLIQKVYNAKPEIRIGNVEHSATADKAITVTGQVLLPQYRDEKGGMIFDTAYPGDDYWANFILIIPKSAAETPAPVVIYGHGIGADKETMTVVDKLNAELGIATFAVDQPNHGTRSEHDGGFIWDILRPEHLNRVVGMVSQSSLDMVSVLATVEQELGTLNTLPYNPNASLFPWLALSAGDDTPDLDLSRVYYEGTSMGGVLGSAFLGLTPRIDGAFLQVSGSGIINILTHSSLWSRFKHMAPDNTLGAELAAYLGMLTQALDYGDGINSVHHVREGTTLLPYPYTPFPLALQVGLGDGVVFNNSSVALSELVQLPAVIPDRTDHVPLMTAYEALPLTKLPADAWMDENGYAMRVVKPFQINADQTGWLGRLFDGPLDLINSVAPHASFMGPGSHDFQRAWTDRIVLSKATTTPTGSK